MMRLLRPLAVLAALVTASFAGSPRAPESASAQAVIHQAALVIDTGTEVKSVCVRFREATLSGQALLEKAGTAVDPKFRSFPGTGAAVCSLCGTGCPADGSCLTCGGANYWSYWRPPAAAAGAEGSFAFSEVGSGQTVVEPGAVEGWRWGDGKTPPPYRDATAICADPASTIVDASPAGAVSSPSTAGTPAGLIAFAGVAAALAGLIVWARIRRRRA